ncbi:MAG TPA: hypothetical protein VEI58_03715 [Chthoniobacterales bacterium]|nr:hypothetical protein [Chthoniobacterales bacterium]HXY60780.1 hypothetical protein [Chthoniobacterales bacterium]
MNGHGDDWVEDNPTAAAMEPRGDVWEQTKQRAGRARERTNLFLRENPVPMMVSALLVGVAIGFAIRLNSTPAEKVKEPIGKFSWTLLPFLWPLAKLIRDNYNNSAEAVLENVDRLKKIDIDRYTKPIRKRWKNWLD